MRFFYDVSMFIIINIIFMNIISGIIIDAFAELRIQKKQVEEDMDNICFICSLGRHKFENTPEGYEYHVKVDHNPWNYIFFLYSITKKDSTEFNGMETYVSNMFEAGMIRWLPLSRAMVLKESEESAKEFRKYLEKAGVIDQLTRVLVGLYEEPEKPNNAIDFIKGTLGAPSDTDVEKLQQENDELKGKVQDLEKKVEELQQELENERANN